MYCKNCGTLLNDGALFCHNCGNEIKKVEPTVNLNEQDAPAAEIKTEQQNPSPFAQPVPPAPTFAPMQDSAKGDKSALAVASLVLGIVSLLPLCCVNYITAILGLVFGLISIKSSKKGMAIAGVVLSVIAIVVYLVTAFFSLYGMVTGAAATSEFYEFFNEYIQNGPMYY